MTNAEQELLDYLGAQCPDVVDLAPLHAKIEAVRNEALFDAWKACVSPKQFTGGPSTTRSEAWEECRDAILALNNPVQEKML